MMRVQPKGAAVAPAGAMLLAQEDAVANKKRMRKWLGAAALAAGGLIMAAAASSGWFASFGGRISGERLQRALRSAQYRDGKFVNPLPTNKVEPGTNWRNLRRQFFGPEERVPKKPIPIQRRTAADYAVAPASGLRVTWIGHASTLVEIDGRRVLTDPIWSDRCSPSTLVGPKRFHLPPLPLEELPPIDAVVISHDHYDHLDMATVRTLAARGTHFAVPLGIGAHLERWGVGPRVHHEDAASSRSSSRSRVRGQRWYRPSSGARAVATPRWRDR